MTAVPNRNPTVHKLSDRRLAKRQEPEPVVKRIWFRLWSLIAYSDTTPTRFMLAMSASFWSIFLFLPGDTMTRPVYRYMADLASWLGADNPEMAWASLWAIHAAGMWWRVFSSRPRPIAAFCINSLGVLLFSGAAFSIYRTLTYPVPAAIAPDLVLAAAAFWVLVRTHVNSERGWRND